MVIGATALHAACENGHLAVVKVLVAAGVDVNSRGMQGVTPLYSSITYNHLDIATFLLDNKLIRVNRKMKRDGATALLVAVSFAPQTRTTAFVELLLDRKVRMAV